MANELQMIEGHGALIESRRGNYVLTSPFNGQNCELKRDVDFAVIPGTKSPSLLKSGAEKLALTYGLLQHYTIETKIEEYGSDPFFMYTIKCDLVKIGADGKEYVFSSGIGSANTKERRCGRQSPFDAANSCVKMAEKRGLVAAAISLGGISSMFSQDMENESYMEGYNTMVKTLDEEAPITKKQVVRLFSICTDMGLNAGESKKKLAELGYEKATDIKQKDYDAICKKIAEGDVK